MVDSFRHLLAFGIARAGRVAHRLADFDPAAADWNWSWCGSGSGQGDALFAGQNLRACGLIDGRLRAGSRQPKFLTAVIQMPRCSLDITRALASVVLMQRKLAASWLHNMEVLQRNGIALCGFLELELCGEVAPVSVEWH